MNSQESNNLEDFEIKIIQGGKIKSYSLNEENLSKKFKEICNPLMKELKLSNKDILFTTIEGKALNNSDLSLPLTKLINKYGKRINLYSDKIM